MTKRNWYYMQYRQAEAGEVAASAGSSTPPEQAAETAKSTSLDDLNRVYFKPANNDEEKAKIGAAIEKARLIAQEHGLAVDFNWNAAEESLPAGYGVAIVPVNQRRDSGTVTVGVYIAGIPDPELIAQNENGPAWIRNQLVNGLVNKFANAVRPRGDNSGPVSVPFTVEDFITTQSRDQGLSLFRELAPTYVKALKNLGLRVMNMTLLRQVLSSKSFAEQQFPKIAQEKWQAILGKMIAEGKENGANLGMLQVWLDTREATDLTSGDFDLDDLDELIQH